MCSVYREQFSLDRGILSVDILQKKVSCLEKENTDLMHEVCLVIGGA